MPKANAQTDRANDDYGDGNRSRDLAELAGNALRVGDREIAWPFGVYRQDRQIVFLAIVDVCQFPQP